ncbi:DUF1642 domain-containing protein [Lactiplantibacillus plantarum]|uniref:DUF1642 domain-containing protein n=1 Tax=Lactiplantibacillus plantarum TaxID=1590 RepID=UPI003A866A70
MIKIYRKTATIKAEQFDGSDEMINKYHIEYDEAYTVPFRIEAIEGWIGVEGGDWIATGVHGEHWIIADVVFKQTYAELPVIPEEVSLSIKDWKKHSRGLDQIFGMVYQYEITRTQGSTTINWIMCGNQDAFARAWLDGYVVEEEHD